VNPAPAITPETLLAQAAWVHRLARALLRDRELAHDVAQDALLAGLSQGSGQQVQDPRGWLHTVIRRLAGLAVRERRERAVRERARPDVDRSEERSSERLRLYRRLCDAVLALPEPYRTAVSRRFFDELTPRAIARELGVDSAVVRQRVRRGLAMLRERFDAEPGGRSEWLGAFAAAGLGAPVRGSLLVPVIAMKKVAFAAILLLAVGAWWLATAAWPASVDATHSQPDASGERARAVAAETGGTAPATVQPGATELQRVEVGFVVRVVDAEEHPLRDATVHCWREGGDVTERQTDASGRCSLVSADERGGVLVRCKGFVPVVQELPALRGLQEVVLGRGSVVAGNVLVDGAPAPAGLLLRLSILPLPWPPSAPRALLDLLLNEASGVSAATDGAGRFRFAGLPADWSGGLYLPRTHWLLRQEGQVVEGDDRLLLPRPQRDLLVTTTRLPVLQGRVLWSDTGEPVPGVLVHISQGELADGTKVPGLFAKTDADGRFAVGLPPSRPEHRARWLDPQRRSAVTHASLQSLGSSLVLDGDGSALDLGREYELRVDRPPMVWYRAVDAEGKPIAGARMLRDGGVGEPSGADGLGWTYDLSRPEPFRSQVGAPGRQVVPLTATGGAGSTRSDPIVVVLPPCNGLRLRVRSADGSVPEGCMVKWRGPELYQGGTMGGPSELHRFFGASYADVFAAWTSYNAHGEAVLNATRPSIAIRLDARGEAMLHSIKPGVAGTLVVSDNIGTELLVQDLTTPALGEVRQLELVVRKPSHRVHGRVVASDGTPVAQALVLLSTGPAPAMDARTAGDGGFRFAPLYGDGNVKLKVRRQGLATAQLELAAEEMDREVVVTMAAGRRTTVAIVDEMGAVIPQLRLELLTGTNDPLDLQRTASGEYVCSDLPPGQVTFACTIGGKRFELRHDTADPRAELRVPRPARAEIAAPEGWPPPAAGRLVAIATRTDVASEPLTVELGKTGEEAPLFLPGRYRMALSLQAWRSDLKRSELVEQGPSAEVELRAGETARVQLR
jgi:RNA polymerase sigma-70 factor (ECF subfamily)